MLFFPLHPSPSPVHETFIPGLIIDPPLSPSEGKKKKKGKRNKNENCRVSSPVPAPTIQRMGGSFQQRTVHFRRKEFIHFPRGGSEFRRNGAAPLARGTSICKENSRPK